MFKSSDPQIALMHNFFAPTQTPNPPVRPTELDADAQVINDLDDVPAVKPRLSPAELAWFSSDEETGGEDRGEEADDEQEEDECTLYAKEYTAPNESDSPQNILKLSCLPAVPP